MADHDRHGRVVRPDSGAAILAPVLPTPAGAKPCAYHKPPCARSWPKPAMRWRWTLNRNAGPCAMRRWISAPTIAAC